MEGGGWVKAIQLFWALQTPTVVEEADDSVCSIANFLRNILYTMSSWEGFMENAESNHAMVHCERIRMHIMQSLIKDPMMPLSLVRPKFAWRP